MAEAHAFPSRDPADDGSLLGVMRTVLDKFLQGVDDMLPARVLSYDRATNRATVLPMVKLLTTDNRKLSRAQVASVPVLQHGGGGFVLSFNLRPGDLGWIKANDRDISLVLQAYADDAPNTLRKHSFEDALFIPDVMRGYSIAGEDASNAVFQSLDGSVKVSLWEDRLKLYVGSLSLTMGPSLTTIVGPVVFTDPVTMQQTLQVDGHSTLTGGANIGGIEFGTHLHSDPQGGNVGPPHS